VILWMLWACTDATLDDSGSVTLRPDFALQTGPVQSCDDPLPGPSYVEVGATWGLRGGPDPSAAHGEGGSLAVLDVDDDGDLDVVLGFTDDAPRLYRRDGDGFSEETLPGFGPWMATTADVDGDGTLDLLFGGPTPSLLLARDGGFEVGVLPELPDATTHEGTVVKELSAGDLDGDGAVDLYAVVNTGQPDAEDESRADFLLHGDGAGGFTVDEGAVPLALSGRSGFDATWLDWQQDGDLDVYVVQDMGNLYGGNVLHVNDGGVLSDGSEACDCGVTVSGMGLDVGDVNGDGLPDLYVAATGGNVLLESQPDGSLVDTTAARGAAVLDEPWRMPWGSLILDHDNDGLQDLLVAQGDLWFDPDDDTLPIEDLPLTLLSGDGEGFTDVSAALGLTTLGSWRSAVAADHNDDGVLDLLVSQVVERPSLYVSEGCTAAGWLAVEAPPHARVVVETERGRQTAWTTTESAYGAARPPVAWFGLGDAERVERLIVTLPDGRTSELTDLAPRRRVTAHVD
jgi:hypothetical protein